MTVEPKKIEVSEFELDALHYGIDVDLLDYNLRLTPEERIRQHEGALKLVQELVKAREALHSEP